MRRRLLVMYMTLTAFVLAILEIPLGLTFSRHELRSLSAEVERDAFVMAASSEDVLEGTGATDLDALVDTYEARTGARAVIVDKNGLAVADSQPTSPSGSNFSTRLEFRDALAGNVSSGTRHSDTLGTDLLYVAVPVASGGVVHGAVRITYPMAAVQGRVSRNWLSLGLVAIVVLVVAFGLGWRFSSSIARPLRALESTATDLARGELTARAQPDGPPEVRSVAGAFNQMAERLDELVTAQQQFVADASHQLRTPLAALQLRLEQIEDEAQGQLQQVAMAAGREAWRLERIVEGLLALARAEGARPERTTEDVNDVIEQRCAQWAPLASERSVRLEQRLGDKLAVRAVPNALEQTLDNLIENALEVAPAGSAISIEAAQVDSSVEIRVVDRGPGMTSDERAHAFDRFWRAAGTEDGGTGLGLSIVRQLARASGGEATLEDAPGTGLTAVVRLPSA